jgi:NAD(P)H-dependent FMN reductase
MIKIFAISGSLRASSSSTAILRAATALAPDNIPISFYEGLGDLPHFNPELNNDNVQSRSEIGDRIFRSAMVYSSVHPNMLMVYLVGY